MSSDGGTKREFERHLIETETLGVEIRDTGGRTFAGKTRNMSASGAYVDTPDPPAAGSEVQLFIGTTQAALRTVARVVHVDAGQGFGAQFLDADEGSRNYFASFIQRFKKK